jgi:hypothetical protein
MDSARNGINNEEVIAGLICQKGRRKGELMEGPAKVLAEAFRLSGMVAPTFSHVSDKFGELYLRQFDLEDRGIAVEQEPVLRLLDLCDYMIVRPPEDHDTILAGIRPFTADHHRIHRLPCPKTVSAIAIDF